VWRAVRSSSSASERVERDRDGIVGSRGGSRKCLVDGVLERRRAAFGASCTEHVVVDVDEMRAHLDGT
jgi:hypothetical protein